LKNLFDNSWIELASRWILGITFIYASYYKIISPADFAKIIYGYDLFPGVLINQIAIILPFVEFVAGLVLILGIYPRSAALIINGMLFVFIITLSINLFRGHEFICGCFTVDETGYINASGQWIVRDLIYFVLGLYVLLYGRSRRGCIVR
jgi:uncharacterized membrane protein YphA (DoxX/SURF4 family)